MSKLDKKQLTGIAALLVHAAKIDEKYSKEEEESIEKTLLELGANQKELDALIIQAKQNEESTMKTVL